MTTVVNIEHTNGPTRKMHLSFHDGETGYRRCIGAAHRDPFAEPEDQMKVRLLGAALIKALETVIPPGERSEAARLANVAKHDIETAVMYGVKALYAVEPAEKNEAA